MTYREMKKKVFTLIEEADKDRRYMTDDPDIDAKMGEVTNQVMYELSRLKKIPKYLELDVNAGDRVTFADLEKACGFEVYQIASVKGISHEMKAFGTVVKTLESGVLEVECWTMISLYLLLLFWVVSSAAYSGT